MRILLVEDEPEMAEAIRAALQRERYVVDHAGNRALALVAAALAAFDLVLLDRTLPDGDGLAIVENLRKETPGLPIIIMSARGDVSDKVAGLDEGADDYLIKPFAIDELLARIRAVRRRPHELADDQIRAGELSFGLSNEEATVHGERLELPRRELRVLAALMKRRGRTVMRENLEQAVFGFDDEVQSNTLDSHISRLRRKLNAAGAGVEIHAVRGVGYLLREAR